MIGEKLTRDQRMAGITHALGNLVAKFPGPEEQPVPLLTICTRRAEVVRASWAMQMNLLEKVPIERGPTGAVKRWGWRRTR